MKTLEKQNTVQVMFPCVHGLAKGQFVTINCFPAAELKSSIKVVTGVDEEIARRVIGASRYDESDSRAGTGVMALFSNPLFTGESYGLALAIADKLARYKAAAEWKAIYATGAVPADGCGRIDTIRSFGEKLDLLYEKAEPDSLFVYPRKNVSATGQTQDKLEKLRSKGVKCVAIANISDLQGRVWHTKARTAVDQIRKKVSVEQFVPSGKTMQICSYTALAGIACFLIYFAFSATNSEQQVVSGLIKSNNFVLEGEKAFSHQVIKYEEQFIDKGNSVSPKSDQQFENLTDETTEQKTPILESANTDSSAY